MTALPNIEYEVWHGYLMSADDFGVMRASAVTLQADNDRLLARSQKAIQRALEHLITVDLVREFVHQGRRYVYQWDWQDWQKLEYPTRTINPSPPAEVVATCSDEQRHLLEIHPGGCRVSSRKNPGALGEHSGKIPQTVGELSPPSRARAPVNANANANAKTNAKAKDKPPDPQVSEFIRFFCDLHLEHLKAKYLVNGGKDGQQVKSLLGTFGLERLKLLAKVLVLTDDQWISGTDRGIGVLYTKASWLDQRLAEAEAQRAAS